MSLSLGIALAAGLASFFSPCVLSLVPAYIGYLTGRNAEDDTPNTTGQSILHGLFFVLGFSFVFILLGLAFSALGSLLYSIKDILAKLGGVIVILFGIHMTGIYRIPFLEYDLRPHNEIDRSRGYLSSFLMGIFFSAGWSPCVGPVLGSILALAMNEANVASGTLLLISYSLGMSIPFLIAAASVGWVSQLLRKHAHVFHWVEVGMGVVLIGVGILLITGAFNQFAKLGLTGMPALAQIRFSNWL